MLRILKFSKQGNEARFDRRVLFFFFWNETRIGPDCRFFEDLKFDRLYHRLGDDG